MPWTGSAPNQSFQRTDGTRTGSETWSEAAAVPVGILPGDHDVHDTDVGTGISACLKKDGGTQPSANLPMNSFKHTGVANASARDQYAAAGQVADSSLIYGGTAGGTGDALTATLSPAITAYASGMLLVVKASAANTGSATVNANSVGAKTLKKGAAGSLNLDANDIKSGKMLLLAYDGTNAQVLNAPEFPSGTRMLFQQTAAPTGWTKDATHNDKALRIVSGTAGTGGSVAFATAFASQTPSGTVGGTTLSISQMPSHGHPYRYSTFSGADAGNGSGGMVLETSNAGSASAFNGSPSNTVGEQIGGTGGGQSHDHSFTGNAINLAVSYVDVIIASKD